MIRKNQIYETKEDLDITCMTAWRAPFTGGYKRVLPKGERIRIYNDPPATASAVYCEPLRYKELHKAMVPLADRLRFWVYSGYYFCIKLDDIRYNCQLIDGSAE